MAVTSYCTQADCDDILSQFGVIVRTDDDDDGDEDTESAGGSGIAEVCIEQASTDMNRYLFQRYTAAVIAASTWARYCCAVLAVCLLCRRRGNPIPQSLADECEYYRAALEAIKKGSEPLMSDTAPAVARFQVAPMSSNLTVDGRYRRNKVRVIQSTSVNGTAADASIRDFVNDRSGYPS